MKEQQFKFYETPEIGIYKTKIKAVISQSNPNSTDSYEREEW